MLYLFMDESEVNSSNRYQLWWASHCWIAHCPQAAQPPHGLRLNCRLLVHTAPQPPTNQSYKWQWLKNSSSSALTKTYGLRMKGAPFCSFYIISCFVFVAVCFYIFWRRIFQLQCTTGGRWVRAEQTQRILRRSRQAFSKHDQQFQISPIICESVRFVASYSRSNLDLWSRPKIWMTYMDIMNWTAARENTSTHLRSTKKLLK